MKDISKVVQWCVFFFFTFFFLWQLAKMASLTRIMYMRCRGQCATVHYPESVQNYLQSVVLGLSSPSPYQHLTSHMKPSHNCVVKLKPCIWASDLPEDWPHFVDLWRHVCKCSSLWHVRHLGFCSRWSPLWKMVQVAQHSRSLQCVAWTDIPKSRVL